jgi:hypothetical protein
MSMKTMNLTLVLLGLLLAALPAAAVNPPDYKPWGDLLAKYYDPAKGMNYKALKANDKKTLDELRRQMAQVDPQALPKNDQLAYWINLYNISVVNVVVENYPVASIRDISTDFIAHLNVFKKDYVQTKKGPMSLNDVENEKIRNHFMDPRIHFAINCAAKSCPPIRTEPYAGARIDQQLDDQARRFLNGPHGVKIGADGSDLVLHVTKILDWFSKDFESWGGGQVKFVTKFLAPDKQKRLAGNHGDVDLQFDDYSWKLNDASR